MRVAWVLLWGLLLAACARVPDADAIRGTIHAMAQAAEAKRPGDVLGHVAGDFTGNEGEFDRTGLERLVRARLLAATVGVSLGSIEVELDGDRAIARFTMTLTDGSGRWIPDHRARFVMVTGWRKDGGAWRCYNARWTQD